MSESMWAYLISRSIYDHPGTTVPMKSGVRKYQDRPRIAQGDNVTIERIALLDSGYIAPTVRVLVTLASGAERWIDGDKLDMSAVAPHEIIETR